MDAALERRVSVATCWATTRIAVLDSAERYEDSYAVTQEFREWILCIGEHPEMLEDSVMSLKQSNGKRRPLHADHASEDSLEI
ncbi:hypothetical protein [Synechococcus sp. PROS-7-1]|uniref:hypothetical protein n=1 Tax=Synechococcus sp. PROS-7-1 TaxID=1442556 RepID=UPI0016483AB5|nr:hypothetical protein [Synechococcus sp. PROS-7-1]